MAEPMAPTGVRVKFQDGTQSEPITLTFAGVEDGVAVWEFPFTFDQPMVGMTCEVWPALTAIRIVLDPSPVDNETDPQEVGGSDGGRPEGSGSDG